MTRHRRLQRAVLSPRLRLTQLLGRPISPADREGYVYAFQAKRRDPSTGKVTTKMKVGMAQDCEKRARQWAKQCPSEEQFWLFIWKTKWYRRLESVVHAALGGLKRSALPCSDCGRRHQEKFHVELADLLRIVKKYGAVVDRMVRV
ncbi:meiotically up-regulated gene 113-domain-containing protein [Mycena epipterygia]|nr:meiotically up-regulated gene 113-domain-containing protein [Mycena epipterygia]